MHKIEQTEEDSVQPEGTEGGAGVPVKPADSLRYSNAEIGRRTKADVLLLLRLFYCRSTKGGIQDLQVLP